MPVSSATEHWIKQDALSINLNHFGDPDYLQVSVLAGAVVMAFKQDVIGYNAAHNYRTWPLDAANTYLETSSAYHVYARLTRNEVNAHALVVYDPVLRDIEGREITYATNEETGKEEEVLGEADETFFFVFLGKLSSSINDSGNSVEREWEEAFRFGNLDTSQGKNDLYSGFEKMFRPHYDDPLNPDTITWIEALTHLGVSGGVTSFINNGTLDLPSLYDGLAIDNQTIVREEIDGVKTLVAKGGSGEGTIKDINISGTGNAITEVSLSSDGTGLVFTKGLEFALKTDFDATKEKLDDFLEGSDTDTIINKWKELEAFLSGLAESDNLATILKTKADKEYVDDTFVTLATSQTITGEKNFTGGLKVNGCELKYNSTYGYWELDGDLLVTGGISSFASSTNFTPSTIMDGVVVDGVTIKKNDYGQLEVIGGTGGGDIDEDAVKELIESYNYLTEDKLPIATTSVKGIASFDSSFFSVSSGHVSFTGGTVKVVTSEPSSYDSNTLYVIVG